MQWQRCIPENKNQQAISLFIGKRWSCNNKNYFYLNQRKVHDYEAIRVDIIDVYLIQRYYHQNKSIPLLRQMILQIKAVKTGLCKNYCCVVYTKSEDE